MKKVKLILTITLFILSCSITFAQETFSFEDVLKFEDIKTPIISANGKWVAYAVWPEIGDGYVHVQSLENDRELRIERGEDPQLTHQGKWVGAFVKPPYIDAENAGKDSPKNSLKLLQTSTGESTEFERVTQFTFSNNNRWALIHHHQDEEITEKKFKDPHLGKPVSLYSLENDQTIDLPFVHEASMDSTASHLVYSVSDTTGQGALYRIDLNEPSPEPELITSGENMIFSNFSWDHKRLHVAFTEAKADTSHDFLPGDATIYTWSMQDSAPDPLITPDDIEGNVRLRNNNRLTWTYDGKRLFFGLMEADMVAIDEEDTEEDSLTADNLYDLERILSDVGGSVWHWDDPRIKTHEKEQWDQRKNHLHTAVYHFDEDRWLQLTDSEMPNISVQHNPKALIGSNSEPYSKEITWDGWYSDLYLVDLNDGSRTRIAKRSPFGASISPDGRFAIWFDEDGWNLKNTDDATVTNLTSNLEIPFDDEENDRPMQSRPYGVAGWTDGDSEVLIYDKYDIWQFDTRTGNASIITDGEGRKDQKIFRIRDLQPEKESFSKNEPLLLTMSHDSLKHNGLYRAQIGRQGTSAIMDNRENIRIVELAEQSEAILFSRETYSVYPNLWVSRDSRFRNPTQVTHLHQDLTDKYAWGRAELVDWINADGRTVQGVLIYPGNYDPNKRYPVFIYYYERFSQRLYNFNKPVTNHRPNFAQYTSDGYAVFLPDVWFDVPIPGYSATKNIIPGVHKLVEMGVADPDAIGLHGHSWSGYQTAFVVTQTDLFAAAVAGAPVSNMTSAYGGIRWGSGLARQFQYEKTQSRLGVSLWENPNPYIENSPLFFADRINTPLMFQHGDADGAVPWYQSIELYLAMRRLGKESVFLQYYDEPHHLRKLGNRLDYAMKMKEYFDHYLKGDPAPAWITDGVPYKGE